MESRSDGFAWWYIFCVQFRILTYLLIWCLPQCKLGKECDGNFFSLKSKIFLISGQIKNNFHKSIDNSMLSKFHRSSILKEKENITSKKVTASKKLYVKMYISLNNISKQTNISYAEVINRNRKVYADKTHLLYMQYTIFSLLLRRSLSLSHI